ncbi:MAG: hypothetical protein PWQ77_1440 [Kosmotogales bacterium]|nr:hypothetical protein [Kosmotogales bacterium]
MSRDPIVALLKNEYEDLENAFLSLNLSIERRDVMLFIENLNYIKDNLKSLNEFPGSDEERRKNNEIIFICKNLINTLENWKNYMASEICKEKSNKIKKT